MIRTPRRARDPRSMSQASYLPYAVPDIPSHYHSLLPFHHRSPRNVQSSPLENLPVFRLTVKGSSPPADEGSCIPSLALSAHMCLVLM